MRNGLLGFSLFCGVALPFAIPSLASAFTLEEALVEAYQTNPTLQARRAQLRAEDEAIPQAQSGWRPNVEFTADVNGLDSRVTQSSGTTDSTRITSGMQLQITQNLYNGGATQAALDEAKASILASRANLVSVEQAVFLDAVTAYMDVLRDTAVVDLNVQNVNRLVRQLEATRDRYNAGVATLTDVAQAESRMARARSDVLASEGDLEVSKAVFEEIVGLEPASVSWPTLAPSIPSNRNAAKEMALESNPTITEAIFSRRSALHAISAAEADLLPSIDLTGTATHSWDKTSDGSRTRNYQITAQVTVPIYQQGFETSQVRESKLSAGQALIEIEEARRAVSEQAVSAWETYQAVVATIIAIQEETRAAEIALDGVQQEELVGQRTVLDVLDAEQELLDARVSLVRAERDETVALYQLLSAIGGLTATGLGLPVAVYDPGVHFDATKDLYWGTGDPVPQESVDQEAMSVNP